MMMPVISGSQPIMIHRTLHTARLRKAAIDTTAAVSIGRAHPSHSALMLSDWLSPESALGASTAGLTCMRAARADWPGSGRAPIQPEPNQGVRRYAASVTWTRRLSDPETRREASERPALPALPPTGRPARTRRAAAASPAARQRLHRSRACSLPPSPPGGAGPSTARPPAR